MATQIHFSQPQERSVSTQATAFASEAKESPASPAATLNARPRSNKVSNDDGINGLVSDLSLALESAIDEINSVNAETRVLALNARIEAARAGLNGAAFSVVAEEIQSLSGKTAGIAGEMANRTREKTNELMSLINGTVRGTRLSDLALVNIDLIDRNLYERTCDVRWWATDGSLVDALTIPSSNHQSQAALAFASKRLGVILDAYTVYYDLVLCDRNGRVVANGRPSVFDSVGSDQANASWFRDAVQSTDGDTYGFAMSPECSMVNRQPVLIYSCGVRERGEKHGKTIGGLGVLFNWKGLADPILQNIPVSAAERSVTRAYIIDREGTILASNRDHSHGQKLSLPNLASLRESPKGFFLAKIDNQMMCVGHAKAPGFETYSTGWLSVVMQPVGG